MAVFDEPSSSISAPRLYASQSRVWQALTGHGIDLKKVPSMEFVLLSLIAARGAAGITQPELITISGQDKRSVPHRTDELARKNYITKISVQSNKMRTSLCIHTKFVSQNTFIESSAVEDVYQEDGTFVVRNFAQLLYNKVGEGGVVPTRSIREKLVSS
jgi:transcription factor C subunit 3